MIDTKQKAKDILEEYANFYSQVDLEQLTEHLDTIRAEAIKEFAVRLKKLTEQTAFADCWSEGGFLDSINNLVKEMVGEQK
jgi:hypothetical protein